MIGAKIDGEGFQAVLDFFGNAKYTVDVLKRYIPIAARETDEQRKYAAQLEEELQSARIALERTLHSLRSESALIEAIDFVFFGSEFVE